MLSAQLQLWIFCQVIITIKVLNHFRKLLRKVTTLIAVETFFQPTSFHGYFSLSVKIIADESTFFQYMLSDHSPPTNALQASNSQNCKNTFFWRCHHHLKVLKPICEVATRHKDQLINWKLFLSSTISEINHIYLLCIYYYLIN